MLIFGFLGSKGILVRVSNCEFVFCLDFYRDFYLGPVVLLQNTGTIMLMKANLNKKKEPLPTHGLLVSTLLFPSISDLTWKEL